MVVRLGRLWRRSQRVNGMATPVYRYVRNVARSQIPTNNILTWRIQFPPPASGGQNFRCYWQVSLGFGTLPSQPTAPFPGLVYQSSEVWTGLGGLSFGPNFYINPDWARWRLNPQPSPAITFFKLWLLWPVDVSPTITQLT